MSRDTLQTVTLPILINADEPDKADGECAVFPNKSLERLVKVNVFDSQKAVNRINNNPRAPLTGLGLLRRAYETKDSFTLSEAIEQSRSLLPRIDIGTVTEDWTGDKVWGAARWFYSEAMSHAIKNVRCVVWWPFSGEHDPSPGLYCPDKRTAAAAAIFTQCIRVCPQCGTAFIPKQDNVNYCKPSHGVAYRTARSRDKKRTAESTLKSTLKIGH